MDTDEYQSKNMMRCGERLPLKKGGTGLLRHALAGGDVEKRRKGSVSFLIMPKDWPF